MGAIPKVIVPTHSEVHYALMKRIEEGEVEWIQKDFEEADLRRYGRDEVDGVADAVFVTMGGDTVLGLHYVPGMLIAS